MNPIVLLLGLAHLDSEDEWATTRDVRSTYLIYATRVAFLIHFNQVK